MPIETIIDRIPPELRARCERDAERAKTMTAGRHLQDWLDFEVSLQGIRSEAMRAAHVNEPRGRGYNEIHGQLMHHYGLDRLDKTSVTAVLWLTDPQEKYFDSETSQYVTRKELLDRVRNGTITAERPRMGSPITARQYVRKKINELAKGPGEEVEDPDTDERPPSKLKQTEHALAKALQEKRHLEERLKPKDGGSLFDLENDTLYDIGEVVAANCSENRALGIADAIKAAVKRKRWVPAG